MKHFIALLAVLVCAASPAFASAKHEAKPLTDAQMEQMTAGFLDFDINILNGDTFIIGSIVKDAIVKNTAIADSIFKILSKPVKVAPPVN